MRIGVVPSRRRRRMTDVPSASGSPRSRTTRSGRCASQAPQRVGGRARLGDPVPVCVEIRGDQGTGRPIILHDEQPRSAAGHCGDTPDGDSPGGGSPGGSGRPGGTRRRRGRRARSARPPPRRPWPRRGRVRRRGRFPGPAGTPRRNAARDRTSRTGGPRVSGGTPGPPSSTRIRTRPSAHAVASTRTRASRRVLQPRCRGDS